MHKHGYNETLKFNNFSGYYGSIPDGYGGFDWSNVFYASASDFQNQCDTGWTNVCRGNGEAWIYDYGVVITANPKETFNLQSMIAASAWSNDQSWEFISYTYSNGRLTQKASDIFTVGETAQHVNFSTLGNKGDFTKISAFAVEVLSYGSPGNTCTYGVATYGVQLVFDNLKVHWNGKIPAGHSEFAHVRAHAHHPVISMLPVFHPQSGISDHGQSGGHAGGGAVSNHASWHSQLASLDATLGHHDGGGLTEQFALPQPEHFGT